ncbi:MAG: hypothetical protein ACR2M4_07110 [Actinomycetota bacterium]
MKVLTKLSGTKGEAIDDEIAALGEAFPQPTQRFEFLYSSLSILDSKASSLMAFNAIGLTALAVWLEYIPLNWLHLTLDLVFLLFLFSSATCFFVVRLYWSPPTHLKNTDLQTRTLLDTRNRRTLLYRFSWKLSIVAVGLFIIVSAVHMVGTFFRATGTCGVSCSEFYSEKVWGNRDLPQVESKSDEPTSPGGARRQRSEQTEPKHDEKDSLSSQPTPSNSLHQTAPPLRSGPAGEH